MKQKLSIDEVFIQRACDLARLGGTKVSPNPMVGAVIVHQNKIIGEGYHQAYGSPHAEVNAENNVSQAQKKLLENSTIYVSLEPCCIQGKTPPCTDLIINKKIPRVVISALDKSPEVNGKSVNLLQKASVQVTQNVLSSKGQLLSQPRNTFVSEQRPYVILKYAQSKDGFMAQKNGKQIWISNAFSSRLTHKWRSEVNAIMVGTKTAKLDDPSLTTRHYPGGNPTRVVLDKDLSLDKSLKVFNNKAETIIFNAEANHSDKNLKKIKVPFDKNLISSTLHALYQNKFTTLMVEGGPTLLKSFFESGLWDEARVITGQVELKEGLKAPLPNGKPAKSYILGSDLISIYYNPNR